MILFALGIIIGLLLNPIKTKIVEQIDDFREVPQGKTQFLESITPKEKWDKAKNINDILN